MPTPPIPALDLAAALRALGRAYVGETDVPAFAQQIDADFCQTAPLVVGDWIVTVLDGRRHRTFAWESEPEQLVELLTWDLCAECGQTLGHGATWEDEVRGDRVVGQYLAGCRACVAHREAERSAAE